jgi:hypothetical protein
MGHRHTSAVDWNIPIVAKVEERVVWHSWEPRVMLAHETKPPILSDGDVGIVTHVHLKTQVQKTLLTPIDRIRKVNTEICTEGTAVRKKQKWNCSQRILSQS